jgi:hypothetical protein
MLDVPGSYEAWARWLHAFGNGEDLPTDQLCPMDEQLGPQMQSRLLARLADAFHERQRRWNDALVRDLAAHEGTPLSLSFAMAAAKARLAPLVGLADNPLLPRQLHTEIRDALGETVRSAQQSLEQSAARNPLAADRMVAVVRENSLVAALSGARKAQPDQLPAGQPGRRVIL